jgi:ferric-dicitrate binding protein FerR (iron transport regulator)
MRACGWLHDYRDDALRPEQKAAFEAHLAECEKCRGSISMWSVLERELREMDRAGRARLARPSASSQLALVERARGAPTPTFVPRLVAVAAAAALLLVIAGVALYLARTGEDRAPAEHDRIATGGSPAAVSVMVRHISSAGVKTGELALSSGDELPAAAGARTLVQLGRDKIGLDEPGQAVLAQADEGSVRLKLLAGTIACEVATRAGGRSFVVETGEAIVRVVGTRFMVSRADETTTVVVDEGVVEVQREGAQPETTSAGQGLEIRAEGATERIEASDEARARLEELISEHPPEPTPASDAGATAAIEDAGAAADRIPRGPAGVAAGLETWRAWVLAGRYDDAERALTAHLARKPSDAEALVLLASCRRKAGKWRAAASTFERLIQVAGPSRANMARFKAGVIYQERLGEHASAAKLFDGYLRAGSGPKPLEPEALLRLGRSLLALGRTERAKAVLQQLAGRQDGNPATLKARELLKKITGEK